MKILSVEGHVAAGFERVRRNKTTGEPWQENTMGVVHSTTNGLAAMTLAVAHSGFGRRFALRRSDMAKRIAIIQGHPDPAGGHFIHALADAYERAAREAGHEVKRIDVASLGFALLHNAQEWESKPPAEPIAAAQQALGWAEHLVILYPLWLGDMPAVLKGFFEQVLRPGFAIGGAAQGRMPKKLLKRRSARVVVTMGMPAFFYRIYYRAHSLKSLKRNILEFCGVSPVRTTVIGMVEGRKEAREDWLTRLSVLGVQGR